MLLKSACLTNTHLDGSGCMTKFKKPECEGCEYWKTVTGEFLTSEEPPCIEKTVDPVTGVTTEKMCYPDLSIKGRMRETRSYCGHPFECKDDQQGCEYVVCDNCPCCDWSKCLIGFGNISAYKGECINLRRDCNLKSIETDKVFVPEVKRFGVDA